MSQIDRIGILRGISITFARGAHQIKTCNGLMAQAIRLHDVAHAGRELIGFRIGDRGI